MRRAGRSGRAVKLGEGAQQTIRDQRHGEAEQNARSRRQQQFGRQPRLGDFHPALEADRHHQIERQPLGHGLGNVQIRPQHSGEHAQSEKQHGRRSQVRECEGKNIQHGCDS